MSPVDKQAEVEMTKVRVRRVLSFGRAVAIAALISAVMASSPRAQQRPQCAEGLNITVTGKIDASQKMSRNWLFETDIRHPAPPCRVTAIILRGTTPPQGCLVGKSITASGTTSVSEGSFPGAQIMTDSVTCK